MPSNRVLKSVAAVVLVDVAAVYAFCRFLRGVYPPSHPWSGITLVLLAAGLVPGLLGGRGVRRDRSAAWLYVAGLLFSASAWTVAAGLSR